HLRVFPLLFLSLTRLPPRSTLFPYTTLFRSSSALAGFWKRGCATLPKPPSCPRLISTTTFRANTKFCFSVRTVRSIACSRRSKGRGAPRPARRHECGRSEEHTSELQSRFDLVCRLLLEKKKKNIL